MASSERSGEREKDEYLLASRLAYHLRCLAEEATDPNLPTPGRGAGRAEPPGGTVGRAPPQEAGARWARTRGAAPEGGRADTKGGRP